MCRIDHTYQPLGSLHILYEYRIRVSYWVSRREQSALYRSIYLTVKDIGK